jgi:hypothetical protein
MWTGMWTGSSWLVQAVGGDGGRGKQFPTSAVDSSPGSVRPAEVCPVPGDVPGCDARSNSSMPACRRATASTAERARSPSPDARWADASSTETGRSAPARLRWPAVRESRQRPPEPPPRLRGSRRQIAGRDQQGDRVYRTCSSPPVRVPGGILDHDAAEQLARLLDLASAGGRELVCHVAHLHAPGRARTLSE